MRYIVISVACLECANYGEDIAEVVLQTNDLEKAQAAANENPYPGQEARILLNMTTGVILKSSKD